MWKQAVRPCLRLPNFRFDWTSFNVLSAQKRWVKSFSTAVSIKEDPFWSAPLKKVLKNHPETQYAYPDSTTVLECARGLVRDDLSSVLVFENVQDKLRWIGIFSERDIVRKVASQGLPLEKTQLKKAYTTRDRVETITVDKTVQDVVDILVSKDVQNIAVLYQKKHGDAFREDCYVSQKMIAPFFEQQTVKDVLESKGLDRSGDNTVYQIHQSVSVDEAIQKMDDHKVGTLLVTQSESNRHSIVGLLTERNFIRKCILQGKNSRETLASDIMIQDLPCIHLNTKVSQLLTIFGTMGERSLPVVCQESSIDDMSKIHPDQVVFVSVKEVLSHCLMVRSSTLSS
ncbi:CBS domain protein [Galdieria sulphuraria]|uniref:CBS domain protein n=1 Tax=Galdieria sulphuraria TaxID=130081 RepID=M2X0J6_GALSU|nr:CBS domain protein [Galdieria sulphuraria]EME29855.1 CBS domain protein [Galdieria sulphuraria]|eukprot:XP_005706375.1 CBS domain protein [Galdieria sulphuraria]